MPDQNVHSVHALGDVWLLQEIARRSVRALVISEWLNANELNLGLVNSAFEDYFSLHEDDVLEDGYSAAPRPQSEIWQMESQTDQYEHPDRLRELAPYFTRENRSTALESIVISEEVGKSYLITNNASLLRQMERYTARFDTNVTSVSPDYVHTHLGDYLSTVRFELAITSDMLARLREIGQHNREGDVYLQSQLTQYALNEDGPSMEVQIADRMEPHKAFALANVPQDGIPLAVTKDLSDQSVQQAIIRFYSDYLPSGPQNVILLPEDYKYFPRVLQFNLQNREEPFRQVAFASIPNLEQR